MLTLSLTVVSVAVLTTPLPHTGASAAVTWTIELTPTSSEIRLDAAASISPPPLVAVPDVGKKTLAFVMMLPASMPLSIITPFTD